MKNLTITKILLIIVVVILLLFVVSYVNARIAAVKYLQIMTIRDEESYQRVKKQIYNISSDYVRKNLFETEHYEGAYYGKIEYKVDKVRCLEIKGFRHFIFEITFTVKDWKTIQSLTYVKNGRVYDTHRKD